MATPSRLHALFFKHQQRLMKAIEGVDGCRVVIGPLRAGNAARNSVSPGMASRCAFLT
jgi:hypothetical protein